MSMLGAGTVLDGRYDLRSEGVALDVGTLHEAYDLQAERLVDVLILALQVKDQEEPLAALEQAQSALAALSAPGLVLYEQIGLVEGQPYLVRRHLEAESLADRLWRQGPLDVQEAVAIAIGLCEVLAPVHRAGLVHGSLSPHSVWLAEKAQEGGVSGAAVMVTDTALLPALRSLQSAPGQPWGRVPYLTPEQVAGEPVHPASDVYVIGSLFYPMLAARPPFRSSDSTVLVLQHLRQEPPSLQVLAPEVSPPLAEIVQKALAKEPAARYRNAGQLAHILRTQLRIPPSTRPSSPPPILTQPAGRDRMVVPAPARTRRPALPPVVRNYEFIEDGDWAEPREGVDRLLVVLFVVAILAVLGLVPLWHAVYQRYSVPPALPAPASQQGSTALPSVLHVAAGVEAGREWCQWRGRALSGPGAGSTWGLPGPLAELDGGAVLWYN